MKYPGIYRNYIKRILDITGAAMGLMVLWPLLLALAILVRITIGSPVIFKQKRPGKDEKIFTLYKFRSMSGKTSKSGVLLSDEERLTPLGKVLRELSLDELPELYNILKGDMSFVGPRPLLTEYLPLYNEEQKRRHLVKPGLTGLAQTRGRNRITWEERFRYDLEYVDHVSFRLDINILTDTVIKVLRREGISSGCTATMEPFLGNREDSSGE